MLMACRCAEGVAKSFIICRLCYVMCASSAAPARAPTTKVPPISPLPCLGGKGIRWCSSQIL